MTDRTRHNHAHGGTGHDHPYLPAMGHDHLLPFYDLFTRLAGVTALHRRLVDEAAIDPGAHVLEIGTGTGNLAVSVARRYPSATVTGLDPDPKGLAVAARKAVRRGLGVRWDRGFAGSLPYGDAQFDRVLSSMMFHHLDADEKPEALREAWRVLRPGGRLLLLDMVPDGGARRPVVAARLADNAGDRIPEALRAAGFTDVRRAATVRLRLGLGVTAIFSGVR